MFSEFAIQQKCNNRPSYRIENSADCGIINTNTGKFCALKRGALLPQYYQLPLHCRCMECADIVKDAGFGCREFNRLLLSGVQVIVHLVRATGHCESVVFLCLFRL